MCMCPGWYPRLLRIWIHFSSVARLMCDFHFFVRLEGIGLRYFSGEKFSEPWLAAVAAPPFDSYLYDTSPTFLAEYT